MASNAALQRLEQRAQMADDLIAKLKQQVGELKQCAGNYNLYQFKTWFKH